MARIYYCHGNQYVRVHDVKLISVYLLTAIRGNSVRRAKIEHWGGGGGDIKACIPGPLQLLVAFLTRPGTLVTQCS